MVAREFNLVLAIDQSTGEIRFLSAQGDPAGPLPVLDGRSNPDNYPTRRNQQKFAARAEG
jgi:hypothetical protein